MGFRISGPSHATGQDRLAGKFDQDEGYPGLHWFLVGIEETDPAGNPVDERSPGTLTITYDESSGKYRVTLRDPASGSVAFWHCDTFSDVVSEMDGAFISGKINWRVDKFAKKSKMRS